MATISIADNDARVQYTQAVTANTTQLTIDFPFFDNDDINVIVTSAAGVDTTLTRGTGTGTFAVVGTSVDDGFSGGYVTLGDTYSDSNTKYTIFRDIDVERTTDFPTSGPFNISSLNTELDKIFAIEQELETKIGRTLKLSDSDTAAELSLPNLDARKGTVLAFNTTTGLPEAGPEIGDVSTIAAITADIGTLADIEDGTDATDAIQTVAGKATEITNLSGISTAITNVNNIRTAVSAVDTNSANVDKVAAIDANVTKVANIDSDVTTVAGIDTDITNVAADATDIGAVAAKATEIGRLGTADAVADLAILGTSDAVSDMNTLAAISNDISSVADKASFITADFVADLNTLAVTDVVNDINTLATSDIVSDLNTLATSDIVSDLNTLATTDIVNDINTLATSDIVSDLNLLATSDFVADLNTMATSQNVSDLNDVAGSINNVNTVATNLSSVNDFAARYRVSANAPTDSLDSGDLWFDSTNNIMKVYGSGGFVNAGSSVNGTSERQDYVVGTTKGSYDGSTTVFPATYDSGFVDVYLNGIKLQPADFTATNGTSVTLGSAAQTSDTVSIVGYGTFELSNFSIGDANNVDLTGLADDHFLQYNSTSGNFEPATVATDLSGDSTPQLGGDLDVQTNSIVSTSNRDINISPNGTGTVVINTDLDVDNININGNTISSTDTNGDITLDPNGTGDTIIASGNLGINTTSPAYSLQIGDGTASENMRINSSGTALVSITSGTSSQSRLEFGDSGDDDIGYIYYDNSNNSMQFAANASERVRIDSSGRVLLGTTTSSYSSRLEVSHSGLDGITTIFNGSTANNAVKFRNSNGQVGSIVTSGSGTTFNTSSDIRLKTDIQPIADATDKLMQMQPVTHKWIAEPDGDTVHGFIAQDMQQIVPEAVSGEDGGEEMMSMDYGRITPVLVAALQEANHKIEQLEQRIAEMENN